jgi:hypothetical protein
VVAVSWVTSPAAVGHATRPIASRARRVPGAMARAPVNDQLCAPSSIAWASVGSVTGGDRSSTPRSDPAPLTCHATRTDRAAEPARGETSRVTDHPSGLCPTRLDGVAPGVSAMDERARSLPSPRRSTSSIPEMATRVDSTRSRASGPSVTRKPSGAGSTGATSEGAASESATSTAASMGAVGCAPSQATSRSDESGSNQRSRRGGIGGDGRARAVVAERAHASGEVS